MAQNQTAKVVVPPGGELELKEKNKMTVDTPSGQPGTVANVITKGKVSIVSEGGIDWIGSAPPADVIPQLVKAAKMQQKTGVSKDQSASGNGPAEGKQNMANKTDTGFYITVKGLVLEKAEGVNSAQVKRMKVKPTDDVEFVMKQLKVPVPIALKNGERKELDPSTTMDQAGIIDGSVLYASELVKCESYTVGKGYAPAR